MEKKRNYAFIDGQNLYKQTNFSIDFAKFRVYLKDKYNIENAYYFLGFKGDETALYENLQMAGFIVVFSDRNDRLKSEKKGNVDTHIVFKCMYGVAENEFDKAVIISGDGDYLEMIKYLIERDKFKAILVPSTGVSSLYKKLKVKFVDKIDGIRQKIEYGNKHKKRLP